MIDADLGRGFKNRCHLVHRTEGPHGSKGEQADGTPSSEAPSFHGVGGDVVSVEGSSVSPRLFK